MAKGHDNTCSVCVHPGVDEINAMILSGTDYRTIIERMKAKYPSVPELTKPSISRHKTNHLYSRPITTINEKGEQITYLPKQNKGKRAIYIDRKSLPDGISIAEALNTVIAAGVANILEEPGTVTPPTLIQALDLARKLGLLTGDANDFTDAWAALSKKRSRRTRKVTLEETYEDDNPESVIDGESTENDPPAPALPEQWDIDNWQLPAEQKEENTDG